MTVESNYVIAIATLSDWLQRLAPVFQPIKSKTKTNRAMYVCDWFIALFAPVVIGLVLVLRQSFENRFIILFLLSLFIIYIRPISCNKPVKYNSIFHRVKYKEDRILFGRFIT